MLNENARPKLLFVISSDYGELLQALYFVLGQPFDAQLLVPPSLLAANGRGLPVPARGYESVGDVLAAVDRERPDAVFLLSGYLYVTNALFTLEELNQLVQGLQARGIRAATSDPFLGVLAGVNDTTFNAPDPYERHLLAEEYRKVYQVVSGLPHLYLVEPSEFAAAAVALSFSNRNLIGTPSYLPCRPEYLMEVGADAVRPRWLFILSNLDYWFAAGRLGGPRFDDLLAERLAEAAAEGKQPILLAPAACTSAVVMRSPNIPGLILLNQCRVELFLSLLLEAEYAFYWNLFSCSLIARSLNTRPAFFFDAGHMVRFCTPLGQRGLKHYYGNEDISYLDMSKKLRRSELDAQVPLQERLLAGLARNLLRSPSPRELVQRLLLSR